jgi:tetratricopeptide (TPR) repeat protein
MRKTALLAIPVLCLVSTQAWADAAEVAKAHFQKGQAAYDVEDFDTAVKEYKAAYVAKAVPALLFNIAQCYRRLGEKDPKNYASALRYYRQYLKKLPNAANASQTQGLIAELEAKAKGGGATAAKPSDAPPAPIASAQPTPTAPKPAPPPPPPLPAAGGTPPAGSGEWADVPRAQPTTDPAAPATRTVVAEADTLHVSPPPAAETKKNEDNSVLGAWWFWTLVGVVVVAAAGVGTGVYVASKNNKSCNSTATWTICVQ